jgi:hypothetical protein
MYKGTAFCSDLFMAMSIVLATTVSASAFQFGNWKGSPYYKNNRFTHCAMSASYRNGSKLIFGIERNAVMSIGIFNPSWRLSKGRRIDVTYYVDGVRAVSAPARVLRSQQVASFFKGTSRVFSMMRHGQSLALSTASGTMRFSLQGTNGALTRLLNCAVRAKRRESSGNIFQ